MTEDEIIQLAAGFTGVDILTAGEATGAPEVAWGDSFVYYDPDGNLPADNRFPFATIVTGDYPGFDESSRLNRPGIFRLNISVGRQRFTELLGYSPGQHDEHHAGFDYAAADTLLPHPVYAKQGWVSIVNPAGQTDDLARELLAGAHERALTRHRPRA